MKKTWDVTVTIIDKPPEGQRFLTKKEIEQEVRDVLVPFAEGLTVRRKVEAQDRVLYADATFTGFTKIKAEGK